MIKLANEIEKKYGLIFIEILLFTQADINFFIKSFTKPKIELPNTVELFWAKVLKGSLMKYYL